MSQRLTSLSIQHFTVSQRLTYQFSILQWASVSHYHQFNNLQWASVSHHHQFSILKWASVSHFYQFKISQWASVSHQHQFSNLQWASVSHHQFSVLQWASVSHKHQFNILQQCSRNFLRNYWTFGPVMIILLLDRTIYYRTEQYQLARFSVNFTWKITFAKYYIRFYILIPFITTIPFTTTIFNKIQFF